MKNIRSILKNIFVIYLVNLTFIGLIIFTIAKNDFKNDQVKMDLNFCIFATKFDTLKYSSKT